jgi:hypothetical protein
MQQWIATTSYHSRAHYEAQLIHGGRGSSQCPPDVRRHQRNNAQPRASSTSLTVIAPGAVMHGLRRFSPVACFYAPNVAPCNCQGPRTSHEWGSSSDRLTMHAFRRHQVTKPDYSCPLRRRTDPSEDKVSWFKVASFSLTISQRNHLSDNVHLRNYACEFFHLRNHLGGISRDWFFHLWNYACEFFHLRNHLGGISRDWFFHLQNHFGEFFTFGIISVGFHEMKFSPFRVISGEFYLFIYLFIYYSPESSWLDLQEMKF